MEIANRIIDLLYKHVREELDAQELAELTAWGSRAPAFQQLLDDVSDERSLREALQAFDQVYGGDTAASIARMEHRIAEGIQAVSEQPSAPPVIRHLRKWLPYAAAILVVLTAVIWMFYGGPMVRSIEMVDLAKEEVAPGGNRARLTFADGRTVDLSEEQAGIVVSDDV